MRYENSKGGEDGGGGGAVGMANSEGIRMNRIKTLTVFVFLALLAYSCENSAAGGDTVTETPQRVEIEDLIVGGMVYSPLECEISVRLTDEEKFNYCASGKDVGGWFGQSLLDRGLGAKLTQSIRVNAAAAKITISGWPLQAVADEPLSVTIPAEYIKSGVAVASKLNENALLSIAAPVHEEGATAISTAAELASIGGTTDGLPLDGSYYLAADIDISAYDPWDAIGLPGGPYVSYHNSTKQKVPFSGALDGNGHKISGLKLPPEPPHYGEKGSQRANFKGSGLFGLIDGGVVKNLTVELAEGYDMGTLSGDSHLSYYIGGLAGRIDRGGIAGVTVRGKIDIPLFNAMYADNQLFAGGIAGYSATNAYADPVTVTGCVSEVDMDIVSKGAVIAGGLAGSSQNSRMTVMHSSAGGNIKIVSCKTWGGNYFMIGGFTGRNSASLTRNSASGGISLEVNPIKDTALAADATPTVHFGGNVWRRRRA